MPQPEILKVIQPNESPPIRVVPKPAKKIKVGLVEINNAFGSENHVQYYLPLAVGMLQAYAQKHLTHADSYDFILPLYRIMRVEEASEILSDCDLVGFSTYVWSEQNSLAIAKDYKRRKPNGLVVFGGPQVPDSKKQFRRNKTVELNPDELKRKRVHFTENYHRAHPFIDIACHGEGERAFKAILEQMAVDECRDKSQLPSVSYLDNADVFHFNPKLPRMNDRELAETASPFTEKIFEKLMNANREHGWIKMYETDRGCPYTCTYCDWAGATEDRLFRFPMEQIRRDLLWAGEHEIPYLFLCNANFGILERDVEIAEYLAETNARFRFPEAVSTQNAKNPKEHTIKALKILEKAGINKATVMSQQSLNPATLKAVRRDNMELDKYCAIQRELAAAGVYTMTDLILGMPEETHESTLDGICTLIENGQHNRIQFNNLSILVNTEMGNPEYQEHYQYNIVQSRIINYHGKKSTSISGIEEYQLLVLGTNTMPAEDWTKTRALCHLVNLLYFDKLLQIPIMVLRQVYQAPYRRTWEMILEKVCQTQEFPIFHEIFAFFENHAREMQNGSEEMAHSPEWLDIWWYPDEYIFIKLCRENKLEQFYQEAEKLLIGLLPSSTPADLLTEAVKLNRLLIKLPFQTEDLELTLSYDIWEFYRAALVEKDRPITAGQFHYLIDRTSPRERWDSWENWYEKMVWYCNRRGAYLYGNKNPHQEIAGHH